VRRILVITYYYPPSTSSGGTRWAAMVRHLRALGHRVWVITSASTGALADDAEQGVVRAFDLVTSPSLRRALRRPPLAQSGGAVADIAAPALLASVIVPDAELVSWVPAALLAARRLIARHDIECVITSGPPDSAHVAGLLLGRRRPAWIADFRDGWTFQPLRGPWPTAAQRRLDAGLERAVATHAERTIGATRPIADDLAQRLGSRSRWISNGWDPALEPDVAAAEAAPGLGPPQDGWATLVHTGLFSGPRARGAHGRDPRVLLQALRRVNEEAGERARRVRLLLAGRENIEDRELLAAAGLGDAVRHLGLLDRASAIALQRSGDGLLLITGSDSSEATGKIFEYLASGRPVVGLAKDNEAARIIEATRCGVVVAPDDRAGIEAALRALADGTLARSHAPRDLERYIYPGPAHAVLELVEEAIRDHAPERR
jgi:glycosyltransferase involved in cell wall biosynthesis